MDHEFMMRVELWMDGHMLTIETTCMHAGYPTAAAGAEEQGGSRKGRRGKTTSRGEKGFIEGW